MNHSAEFAEAGAAGIVRNERDRVNGPYKEIRLWRGLCWTGRPATVGSLVVLMPAHLRSALHPCTLPFSPFEVARALRGRDGFVWLDSSDDEDGRVSVLTSDPVAVHRGEAFDFHRLRPHLVGLEGGAPDGARGHDLGLPGPGLFGTVDFNGDWCFGVYPEVLVYRHGSDQWWESGRLSRHVLGAAGRAPASYVPQIRFHPEWTETGYLEAVHRALGYIADGDIYQVNLSQPWASDWPAGSDVFGYYERLRGYSPSPQAAFLDLGGRQVASASPELFLRISGRTIRTRPIKGTRPRHREVQDDERAAYDLITSPKEIAELIMITDLERNDLGRVCEFGSVTVPDMLRLERFQQVFHLVSTVEGTLRADVDHLGALAACLPGGSISGAPKIRALQIIEELEPFPRGLYTGVIGWIGASGESQFSIAIRTAIAEGDRLHFHTGAGIVADSDPRSEYAETWHKAATLLGAAQWPR